MAETAEQISDGRFALISKVTNDAIWDWDLCTNHLWWSEGVERIFGFALGDIPPSIDWWFGHIHPDDRPRVTKEINDVIEGGQTEWKSEYRYRRRDDSYAVVSDKGVVTHDAAGKPVRMLGGMRDVTESVRTQEALRRSEAQFRAVFEMSAAGAALIGLDGRILRVNRKYCDILGHTAEELMARKVADVTHPDDRALGQHQLDRVLRGELSRAPFEVRYLHHDGHAVWVETAVTVVPDHEGRPSHWSATVLDINDRKQAEAALREAKEIAERSRAEQQAIVQNMTEGVAVVDATGRLLDMNPAALVLHGFDSLEALLRDVTHLEEVLELRGLNGNLLPPEAWPLARALRGETFTGYEVRVSRRDGSHACIASYGGSSVRDTQGRIVLAVSTLRDVTRQREAEMALAVAKAQLEHHARHLEETVQERTARLQETVHELEAFSYSLSHDMRAPLRAMKGFSQILLAKHAAQLGDEGAAYLNRIAVAAGRLDQLIQDVLAYSRIVREGIELAPVDIEPLAHQLIGESPALQPPHAEIRIESPLLPVMGHEAYLTQVLSNLLYNAVKFITQGKKPRVRIWTETVDGNKVRLAVQDNGIGIPRQAQPRLFGMFERMHGDAGFEGTGIGLAIVRKAVERMGGRIDFTSEEGQGTTFWVYLEKAKAQ